MKKRIGNAPKVKNSNAKVKFMLKTSCNSSDNFFFFFLHFTRNLRSVFVDNY
jgi:hypothetical protein